MPVEHHWEEPHGLHTRYLGKVTGDDLVNAALEVGGDPRFDHLHYVIGDWSGATDSRISLEDVKRLAAHISAMAKTNPRIRNASVMYNDETRQGLVALYNLLTEDFPWKMAAFHTLEEARAWATRRD